MATDVTRNTAGRLIARRFITATGVPAPTPGARSYDLTLIGGGGGGGGVAAVAGNLSGGGGASGNAVKLLGVTPAQLAAANLTAVGAGGAGGAAGANGTDGNPTTLTIGAGSVSALGGRGGVGAAAAGNGLGGMRDSDPATNTSGLTLYYAGGQPGEPGGTYKQGFCGGNGGGNPWGAGGYAQAIASANGTAGFGYGAGGGGANTTAAAARTGGAGVAGVLIIEAYS